MANNQDQAPDVIVEHHGTIFLFRTDNPDVHDWFEAHTDAQALGNAYAVGPRYVLKIVEVLMQEGFHVA